MKRKYWLILVSILILLAVVIVFMKEEPVDSSILVKPKHGEFLSTVSITGELRAKNSIDVRGPENAQGVGIWQMKITKLVDEGTIVNKGDFIAELDKSEITDKLKDAQLQVQKSESQLTQAKLDSTLTLTQARDDLENLKFSLEEKKLQMEQSKYEAPSIIRQAELEYEKIQRSYEQSKKNYQTKVKQAIAKLSEISAEYQKQLQRLDRYTQTMQEFTITAPAEGMVIYAKEWDGRRIVVGSTVNAWYPIVATLPDLTRMESITYVNEVDIQKIKVGQQVKIGLDADPNKKLTGKVVKIANIGEQKRGSDTKVFEVLIDVSEKDTTLLPAMTTSNEILISKTDNATYIPLECIHSENSDKSKKYFVYKSSRGSYTKQYVELGEMNENEVVIKSGINGDDEIYLSVPENIQNEKVRTARK